MRVSIVTVCLNSAEDLPLTLESVLAQNYPDIELLVVDGGSWDATAQVLTHYRDDIGQLIAMSDAGIFDAMNRSVEKCSGDYVLFLNAGDRFFDFDAVTKIMAARSGSPDVIFGDHIYLHGRDQILLKSQSFEVTRDELQAGRVSHRWHSSIPCHQATFIRTELLAELPYDTRLEICADHDFLFRAFDRGARFQYVDEVVCHYLGGGYSARRTVRYKHEIASVYRRYSGDPGALDALFFPDGETPFLGESATTGLRLGGFFPPEHVSAGLPNSFAWCSGQGFSLLSPINGLSNGCVLHGRTPLSNQALVVSVDNEPVGRADIPQGEFNVRISFDRVVPARCIVRFSPTEYGELASADRRIVSLALISARFLPVGPDTVPAIAADQTVPMTVDQASFVERWCVAGWSVPEPEHIWSIGDRSQIMLQACRDVKSIALHILPNPAARADLRTLSYDLNGVEGDVELGDGGADLVIDCEASAWNGGSVNVITLRPAIALAPSSYDDRLLGICLKTITAC